jgi:hypothetical protein
LKDQILFCNFNLLETTTTEMKEAKGVALRRLHQSSLSVVFSGSIEDQDLQRIISGLFSVVDGIGALRTHAGSAHSEGRKGYKLEPRHARLAVNAAHTVGTFIMETWDKRSAKKS